MNFWRTLIIVLTNDLQRKPMKSLEEILYERDDDLPDNPDFNFQKEIKSFINKTKIENSFEYYGRKHSVLT